MSTKGNRNAQGRHAPKRYYRHMTQAKADAIRRAYFARELNQRELAELYGLAQGSVSRIISGATWA